MMINN